VPKYRNNAAVQRQITLASNRGALMLTKPSKDFRIRKLKTNSPEKNPNPVKSKRNPVADKYKTEMILLLIRSQKQLI